ncbi:MAG TPA: 5'-3' exonuclease [Candidatus Dormibacteraeota bacterium]|nr:5'-3' exonuclease [Candidatus Dormibacteraeota bacterium]
MPTDWLLIDGSSLIFRAFYGVPRTVVAPNGAPINGARGCIDNLARLITERRPAHLALATDEDWRPAFRVEALPTYKAHRVAEPVPPELEPQMPVAWDVLRAAGLAVIGAAGFEAEDVIASIVARVTGRVEIWSGDRDLFALVRDPDVTVLYPERGGLAVVDEAEITRRYGIPGRSYLDFAILRGDPSDGLPGLRGVGAKTAVDLVRRHGDLEGIIANTRLDGPALEYLAGARRVVAPVADIPLDLPDCAVPDAPADPRRLAALGADWGLASAIARLTEALARRAAG